MMLKLNFVSYKDCKIYIIIIIIIIIITVTEYSLWFQQYIFFFVPSI